MDFYRPRNKSNLPVRRKRFGVTNTTFRVRFIPKILSFQATTAFDVVLVHEKLAGSSGGVADEGVDVNLLSSVPASKDASAAEDGPPPETPSTSKLEKLIEGHRKPVPAQIKRKAMH